MDAAMIERAKRPNLRVGHGILEPLILALPGTYAIIGQPSPLAQIRGEITDRAASVVIATSLDEAFLARTAAELPAVDHIVGIGGGTAMDAAKYMAWTTHTPLMLAPSIVSVDASVTNTVAVRRDGNVEYDGFVVADSIIADLDLIAAAPPRFNRAGVGDLLTIHTARFDWALGAKAGRISFDPSIDAAAAAVLERLYDLADEVATVSDRALEDIIRAYAEVNALLLEVGHSGPEEGSEHYFAYAAEALTDRPFVHGEIIGLGTVLMSGLQGNDQLRAANFLDRCRVQWRPDQLELDAATLEQILLGLPTFVRDAELPYSVIDDAVLDPPAVTLLLASIPAPTDADEVDTA